eukprot:scaffold228284_cov36-Tisochrysis_lutea.AAC.4
MQPAMPTHLSACNGTGILSRNPALERSGGRGLSSLCKRLPLVKGEAEHPSPFAHLDARVGLDLLNQLERRLESGRALPQLRALGRVGV